MPGNPTEGGERVGESKRDSEAVLLALFALLSAGMFVS